MKRRLHTHFAAIHLGSEKLSMQITEYQGMNRYRLVESCQRTLYLGEATFKNKVIPINLINEICEILVGYKRLMEEYKVDEYRLQATTAVREANNQVFLLDQIYSRTGLVVEVMDMPQEIYTKYVAIRSTLKQAKITSNNGAMLMMDISSGGLGITLVDNDKVKYQTNLHIGIIRVKESFERNKRESLHFNTALTEFLSSSIAPVRRELEQEKARYLVLSGTETELLLRIMNLDMSGKVHRIKAEDFREFFKKVQKLNLPQLMSIYHITENAAELVLPTILLYERLLEVLPAEEIVVTEDSFIDGMKLLHIGGINNKEQVEEWNRELISIIHAVGRRYAYDKGHVEQVERLGLMIFDKIAGRYSLGAHERLLLQGACLLHDIGKFINMRSHSNYSYQLIMDTDILGFSDRDKRIMALAAYYHANDLFDTGKKKAPQVKQEELPLVAKLAAILRIADAMDRSYCQKIKTVNISVKENSVVISVQSKSDLSLEEWTFARKADFFEEVFGLKPVLERMEKL